MEINKNNISLALKSASYPVLAATLVHVVGDIKILDDLPKPKMAMLGEIQGYFTEQDKQLIKSIALPLLEEYFLDTESKETSEMLEIYRKYMAGEKLDPESITKANNQFADLIKNAGLLGVFALPGGLVAIAFLIKLGKKFGVDILPKSFKE